MDPVTMIVAAIALGAAAGLKETATAAVKDAYKALKGLLSRRYDGVNLTDLERKPDSEEQRESVAATLSGAGAAGDADLLDAARQLLATVREHDPAVAQAVGIDLADVEAAFIRVGNIKSTGTGFHGERIKLQGGLEIGDVTSGDRAGREDP
jgi:hypothetical protein